MVRKKIVVSDAAPLIQLSLSHSLEILHRLYVVVIPEKVFRETQYYGDLPDAIEIAKVVGKWLKIRRVKNRKQVKSLLESKWGKGEAEAAVLCQEINADFLLTSDKYAASKAEKLGLKTITIADVVRQAYSSRVITADESVRLLDTLVRQDILNTRYLRTLFEEAKTWS